MLKGIEYFDLEKEYKRFLQAHHNALLFNPAPVKPNLGLENVQPSTDLSDVFNTFRRYLVRLELGALTGDHDESSPIYRSFLYGFGTLLYGYSSGQLGTASLLRKNRNTIIQAFRNYEPTVEGLKQLLSDLQPDTEEGFIQHVWWNQEQVKETLGNEDTLRLFLDFDDTMYFHYEDSYGNKILVPSPGIVDFIKEAKEIGAQIVIFSNARRYTIMNFLNSVYDSEGKEIAENVDYAITCEAYAFFHPDSLVTNHPQHLEAPTRASHFLISPIQPVSVHSGYHKYVPGIGNKNVYFDDKAAQLANTITRANLSDQFPATYVSAIQKPTTREEFDNQTDAIKKRYRIVLDELEKLSNVDSADVELRLIQ